MGIAANAVADLAGPPPRAAANAAGVPDDDAPSFQDHVDVSDRAKLRDERGEPKSDARPQATQGQSSNQSEETTPGGEARQAEEEHADTDPGAVHPPIFLQLIAHAMAPTIGAKAAQPPPPQQQVNPPSTPAEQAAAQAGSAQGNSAQASSLQASGSEVCSGQAAALANTTAPIKIAPKADAAARPGQAKSPKEAREETQACAGAAGPAPEVAVSAPQQQDAAPITLAANLAAQDAVKGRNDAKSDALEAAPAPPPHAGSPHEPGQASPSVPSPQSQPETPPQLNSSDARPRDEAKALPLAQALKQASQDFAQGAPQTQASPSTQPATLSAHPQLAAYVEQGATIAADARTKAAPVAAQVGGEIIRRFNGTDTSFQLRLDPPDLGRVDVRLDVSRDHRITAVFSADSPQALSDLARGARDLQQALQSAGLDLADDGLRFDLSNGHGNGFAQAQAQQDQSSFRAANAAQAETSIAPEIAVQRPLSIDSWRGARVDLMA